MIDDPGSPANFSAGSQCSPNFDNSSVFCFAWCKIGAILVHDIFLKDQTMIRQSISISEPNDEWLKAQVTSAEYSSKSEVINDLIRQARRRQLEIEQIRAELIKAEQSGFIDEQPKDLLANFKEEARRDGVL